MKRQFLLFLVVIAAAVMAVGLRAETPFNGVIQNSELKPVKGAKVYVSDPKKYAKTDGKGRFGLTDVNPGDSLHISVKKMRYVIPVDSARSMRIIITDEGIREAKEDLELVSLGFGFVKRREYNSPTNGISGDRLRSTGTSDIIEALSVLVPNFEVRNGVPLIRGTNSFSSPTEPLYVVDGNIVGNLLGININSVESVEVLKDGSFYGSRGAGGVIVVTTKRK